MLSTGKDSDEVGDADVSSTEVNLDIGPINIEFMIPTIEDLQRRANVSEDDVDGNDSCQYLCGERVSRIACHIICQH